LAQKSPETLWIAVDEYLGSMFAPRDKYLDAALKANRKAGLPAIDVSPLQGTFLKFLVNATRAKRVLEIGLLGGYSTMWMARALPRGGRIVSLEYSEKHAAIASANLKRAGLLKRVDIRVGAALDSLPVLAKERGGKFDLIFIDADKDNNPEYLEWAIKLSRKGTIIVVDNVARHGHVVEAKNPAGDIQGTRRCLKLMASHPRLSAFALQTVGLKGLDGFAAAVVIK